MIRVLERKGAISVKITDAESVALRKRLGYSGCSSLTEYVTRALTQGVVLENQQTDIRLELLSTLTGFILRLDYITDLLIRMKLSRPPSVAEMESWARAIISTIDTSPGP
jgi:hypothetical protein